MALNKIQTHKELIEQFLRSFAHRHCEVELLYLFGSVLTKAEPEDIDIALMLDNQQIKDQFQFRYAFIEAVNKCISGKEIYVVLLQRTDPILCMQVITKGEKVFARNPRVENEFITRVQTQYYDLKRIRKPIEQHILNGRIYA